MLVKRPNVNFFGKRYLWVLTDGKLELQPLNQAAATPKWDCCGRPRPV